LARFTVYVYRYSENGEIKEIEKNRFAILTFGLYFEKDQFATFGSSKKVLVPMQVWKVLFPYPSLKIHKKKFIHFLICDVKRKEIALL
jgi:DNA/RNA endonuclease G (NUC1)